MTTWNNCMSDVYYSNEAPTLRDPGYEVSITDDEIVVSYEGNTGRVKYRGNDLGGGHYKLVAPEVDGQAMLHRYGNSKILTGYWAEAGWHGMWRIYLDDATDEGEDDENEDVEIFRKKRPTKKTLPPKLVTKISSTVHKLSPGSKSISPGSIRKGMTYQEVLNIVGVGNLNEANSVGAFAIPSAKKVMTYRSEGIPSMHLIGFDEKLVVMGEVRFSKY